MRKTNLIRSLLCASAAILGATDSSFTTWPIIPISYSDNRRCVKFDFLCWECLKYQSMLRNMTPKRCQIIRWSELDIFRRWLRWLPELGSWKFGFYSLKVNAVTPETPGTFNWIWSINWGTHLFFLTAVVMFIESSVWTSLRDQLSVPRICLWR